MKRIGIYIVLGLIVIGFIWWLVHYLGSGRITITTNNPNNTITLTKIADADEGSSGKPFSKQAHDKLSLALGTGNYVASVQGNSAAITQAITLKSGQNLTYNLNPANASGVEPVAYVGGYNLAANGSRLVYIDDSSNGLSQIDDSNTITQLDPSVSFQSVHWADATYGVGQDTNGQLYVIDNGSVKPLKNPISASTSVVEHYAIAPDKQLFLTSGSDIYTGTPSGGFKKLYTEKKLFSSIIASNNGVTIINSPVDGPTNTGPSYVVMVTNAGKAVTKSVAVSAATVWSPDDKHLATVDEDDGLEIYDSSLNSIVAIPGTNMDDVVWLDNQTVAYGSGTELWTYNLTSKRANLLANTPLGGPVTELAVSNDGAYLYVVVGTTNSYSIRRVGLRDQTVPAVVYQLQDILPETLSEYSLGLINFTHPTVTVQTTPTSPPSYLQDAKTQLQQDGFDLNQLEVQAGVTNQS